SQDQTLHKSGELIAQLLALMSPSTFQLRSLRYDFFILMRYHVSLRTLGFCSVFKELVCRSFGDLIILTNPLMFVNNLYKNFFQKFWWSLAGSNR
ncbi:hypothetical protein, partial [Alkalicoccobacillus gibsonii]|uniref:hypothetical protein n=1 Tax=Alkalicoccobacillus gibsonii TaxID=79881 RepID=UPI001AEE8424